MTTRAREKKDESKPKPEPKQAAPKARDWRKRAFTRDCAAKDK